jgi:hypothetical protein
MSTSQLPITDSIKNDKKCLVVLNGPSVESLRQLASSIICHQEQFEIIAVNRWFNIFQILQLPAPNYVIVGKNSLSYNIPFMKKYPYITFYGIDPCPFKNYRRLQFGRTKVYDQTIDMKGSLWWSGLYAIQLALKKEYKEIHIFGFTCTDQPDYGDRMLRAPIKNSNISKIIEFLKELKDKGLLKKIAFYEDPNTHPFRDLIF